MPVASEIDRLKQTVLRDHLADLSKISNEKQTGAFTIDRGYLDEKGNSTEFGDEYLTLLDAGLLDEKGELTEDGRIYAMSRDESINSPFQDFEKREKLGLNKLDEINAPKVGAVEGLVGMAKDFFTKSLPKVDALLLRPWAKGSKDVLGYDPMIEKDRVTNDVLNIAKGALFSAEPLATGAAYKGADLLLPLMGDDENENEKAALVLKQEYLRTRKENDAIKGIDLLTAITGGSTKPMEIRERAVEKAGEEAIASQERDFQLFGELALDPTTLASFGTTKAVTALNAATSRAALHAEKMAVKASVLSAEKLGIESQRLALQGALERAGKVGMNVAEREEALRSIGKHSQAERYTATKTKIGEKLTEIKSKIDELGEAEARITQDLQGLQKKKGVGEAMLALRNKAKEFNALPAKVFGEITEKIGDKLIKTDAWLDDLATRTGASGFYDALKSVPGMAASIALGPTAAIPSAIARTLAAGPIVESIGRYSKILGRELMQERGSVPYWRRVANNPTLSTAQKFLSHRLDELTLGGRLPKLAKDVAKGTAAAYPLNLSIEYLQDPYADFSDIAERAGAYSLIFGGGSMGAGGVFRGTRAELKQTRINDEINFTKNLLDSQKAGFDSMSKGAKRTLATVSAAFPNLNFDFSEGVTNRYDPVTNTAFINPKSNNPLRPLIAHEVLHYATARNQIIPVIQHMLLGDNETPGILRKTNGELDPSFLKFKNEYDKRTDDAGIDRRELKDIAEEYFVENTVDHLLEMVEGGSLSKMARKTQVNRQLSKFIEITMPRIPILKDFFFRTGGAIDTNGKFVYGNGLLAEGMREIPEAKAMMRNLMQEIAGEAATVKTVKSLTKEEKANLPIRKGDPIIDKFHSILAVDKNNVPIKDKNGDHVYISKSVDDARKASGLVIVEDHVKRVNEGYIPAKGEIEKVGNEWQGKFFSNESIKALASKGILNGSQIANLRNINTAIKTGEGIRFMIINHPATIKGRGGKVKYDGLQATLRETVPVGVSVTSKGNILIHLINVDQLNENITNRAASQTGRALYQGNTEAIKQDISAMMELHASNKKTDEYYQEKYGTKWVQHKNFINSIFGLMTKAQKDTNPMFQSDKIKGDGVYRTYRLDRISQAMKMDGTKLPFEYDYVKINYLPDGVVDKSEGKQ